MYLIGECFLAMNDPPAALDQFRRTQQGYPESIEGIAAAFQEADLLRRLDRDDEAIAAYRRAAAAVGDPAEFRNPLLSLEQCTPTTLRGLSDVSQSGPLRKGPRN